MSLSKYVASTSWPNNLTNCNLSADITRPWSSHLAVSETEDPTTALVALKRCGEVKLGVMLSRPQEVVKVVRESGPQNGPKDSG